MTTCISEHGGRQHTAVFGLLVCGSCWQTVSSGLRHIPQQYDDLLWPPRGSGTIRISGSNEPRTPLAENAGHARFEIEQAMARWARAASNRTGTHPPEGVPARARFILDAAPKLCADTDYAAPLVGDIGRITREAQRVASPQPPGARIGSCPCGGQYWARDTSSPARCGHCHAEADVDQLLGGKSQMHSRELSEWLTVQLGQPVSHDVVRQWAARGHLLRLGADKQRRTLYDPIVALIHARQTPAQQDQCVPA